MTEMEQRAGIIRQLGELPAEAIIDEAGWPGSSTVTSKHQAGHRAGGTAARRALFGRPTWTARAVLDHLNRRLEEAEKDAERLQRRISQLAS